MKNKLLSIIALVALTSCNSIAQSKSELSYSIEAMKTASYNITFSGELSLEYPAAYSIYNSTSSVTYSRDYGYVNKHKAVRIYNDETVDTYFKSDDGRIYSEFINVNNTVGQTYKQSLGRYYMFDDLYTQPFEYLTERDFNKNALASEKAYFVFKSFTGFTQPVESMNFTFLNNGLVDTINVNFLPYPMGMVNGEETLTIIQSLTGSFKFNYKIDSITHLTPYHEKSSKYTNAVKNLGDNYTLTFVSNSLSGQVVTYVDGDRVYTHKNKNVLTPLEGDVYYVKRGNEYRVYTYTGSTWAREDSISDINDVLIDPANVSANVVNEVSSNHLTIKDKAVSHAGENFVIPYLGISKGTSLRSDIYLKDNRFDYVSSVFNYYSGNIYIKTVFTDYGVTSMPSWFEAPTF